MSDYAGSLNKHYGRQNLIQRIFDALEKTGMDINTLAVDSLGPMEELHIAGREATLNLGRIAGLNGDMHVLDVGCGIGGPARTIAHHFGCHVTGIDLTEEFCTAAEILTQKMGLGHRVNIRLANALDMPFENDMFDAAWMQHASMNIPDKARLFSEVARVLKPNGVLALYEILSASRPILHFPVPFASDASLSFLQNETKFIKDLESAGFHTQIWEDITEKTRRIQEKVIQVVRQRGFPPLNPGILLGPDFQLMAINLMKNLKEKRIKIIQAILRLSP